MPFRLTHQKILIPAKAGLVGPESSYYLHPGLGPTSQSDPHFFDKKRSQLCAIHIYFIQQNNANLYFGKLYQYLIFKLGLFKLPIDCSKAKNRIGSL